MNIDIIKIGNSRGIRIPKSMLNQTGLKNKAQIKVVDDSIIITPIEEPEDFDLALMSELSLKDWNSKEEDEAWDYLNQVKL